MSTHHRILGAIGLALLAVACTRPLATQDTLSPLAPPDTLSQPTTTTTTPTPTTTIDTERSSIQRVDPITLEPIGGLQPLPMGDWSDYYTAATSENGRWLAMTVNDESTSSAQLRLVDLDAWEVTESWTVGWGGMPLAVADDGTAYLVGDAELLLYAPSASGGVRKAIDLPPGYSSWTPIDLHEDRARLFASKTVGQTTEAAILDISLSTGEVATIPLPGVGSGVAGHLEIGDSQYGVVYLSPALVWDHPERVLLVHAIEDVITEVDLATGATVEHRFGPAELAIETNAPTGSEQPAYIGHSRSAVLSADGLTLYVATQTGDIEVDGDAWRTTSTPTGLTAIDTNTWSVSRSLALPVSTIGLSPLGDRILATGYSDVQAIDTYEYQSSGWYLIDSANLQVIEQFPPPDDESYSSGPVTFGPGGLGYLTSWGQQTELSTIDLTDGSVLGTRSAPEAWILGPIGVLGQVAATS